MMKQIAVVLLIGLVAWGYQITKPPPPKTCGSPGGPPITAPIVKLRDGRHLAYKEHGVPRETANYNIIYIHGSGLCKEDTMSFTHPSSKYLEDLGVYLVSFDRPGYGESDPDSKRTPKSLALDVEELADNLGLGPKFYILGLSMGGQAVWGILKYIPHRLAGAALLTPVVNYWWPGLPVNLSTEAYHKQLPQDQWAVRVAHYVPWLTYWWNTQKLFPSSSVSSGNRAVCNPQDLELISKVPGFAASTKALQQGLCESVFRDFNVGFGTWEFDPMDLENPFPDNEGAVHLWQGEDDWLVPTSLQRYIAQRLAWIHYHELPGSGHLFLLIPGMGETIIRILLLDQK